MLRKSIGAGTLIALCCSLYLNIPNTLVGAVVFSLGLLSVCAFKLNLYTGKVGYTETWRDAVECVDIFLGNAIGCAIVAVITCDIVDADRVHTLVVAKNSVPVVLFFFRAVVCGSLMFIGVHAYKKGAWQATILCVVGFILGGAEHSVADTYYFIVGESPLEARVLTAVIGNAIGAIGTYKLTKD